MTDAPRLNERPTIFVVGCPRSGTSPFARWLAACGLRTAEDQRRQARYPAGYFEHMPILMFHKALERLPRGAEHAVRLEPFLTSDLLEDEFIRGMFEAAFRPVRQRELDFVKFPQLALSIDFLLENFPDSHVIGVWRDPAPTFRSLVTREFPREMIPSSGVKAILLWNLYAYHLVRAAEHHPDRVTVLSIDRFLAEPGIGARVLTRAGYGGIEAAPIEAGVDRSLWDRPLPWRWRLYHAAMRGATRRAGSRLKTARRVLADQEEWLRRLYALPPAGGPDGAGEDRR